VLTIFSIPKAFAGHTAVIQTNAIRSWARLAPRCEILLLGDDPGVTDAAAACDATHLPEIATNELGTPLVADAFERARRAARHPLLVYVNADVMFTDDLLASTRRVTERFDRFLMVGRRLDVDVREPLPPGDDWMDRLRTLADDGELAPRTAVDYFVFTRDSLAPMPPFAVGRAGWDNWLVYDCWSRGLPVIDATAGVTALHQRHDYGHVPQSRGHAWHGPESDRNLELAREGNPAFWPGFFTIGTATWRLAHGAPAPRTGAGARVWQAWVRASCWRPLAPWIRRAERVRQHLGFGRG